MRGKWGNVSFVPTRGWESGYAPASVCCSKGKRCRVSRKKGVLWVVISEIQTLEKLVLCIMSMTEEKLCDDIRFSFSYFIFLLEYCGESSHFDVSNGEITNISSPRYPEIFRSKITCEYTITAHSSGRVILSFLTFAFLGIGDIFVVGNGHDHKNESSILLSHKNNVVPPIVTSMAHHMWISFTTDGVQNRNTWFFIQVQQINNTGKLCG